MTARATLSIDLDKITDNARRVVAALAGRHVVGVTKVTCGTPEVGRAMLAGGAQALGESRLENAERLRAAGIDAPIWLLRSPTPELAADAVRLTDVSLESELETVLALERAAGAAGKRHGVIAMVDLGDLREGMLPADLPAFARGRRTARAHRARRHRRQSHLLRRHVPDDDNLGGLAALAERVERRLGRRLAFVSGGNSGCIGLMVAGRMPRGDQQPAHRRDHPAGRRHADSRADRSTCTSTPSSSRRRSSSASSSPHAHRQTAQDAFGNRPTFIDRGVRRRAICALGRQDAPPDGLVPVDSRVEVLGASSDHLILDVEELEPPPALGDAIAFVPNYAATLQLFTSPYVARSCSLRRPDNKIVARSTPSNHRSEHGRENESPDHGSRGPRLPQLQHLLPRQRALRGRGLHRHADPLHQRPQVPGRARRQALPQRHPDPRRVRAAELVKKHSVEQVVFAYSDVPYEYVMHRSALVNALGADFRLMGPDHTMVKSTKPVIAVCAVRTGAGKSQTTRKIQTMLREAGKKVVSIRHPMPYGDLVKQRVQRFATVEDLARNECTIEEMEEYEPHVVAGNVIYAGVDYEAIVREAEKEADVILWDGGNNDFSFYKADLYITVADPHRPGDGLCYYPGEVNLRLADVVVHQQDRLGRPGRHRGRARRRALGEPDRADHHGRLAGDRRRSRGHPAASACWWSRTAPRSPTAR